MFDTNDFKRKIKDWMTTHPQAEMHDLVDFCEELIPPAQFAANQWLVDQTVSWYKHIQSHREMSKEMGPESDDDIC